MAVTHASHVSNFVPCGSPAQHDMATVKVP